MAEFKLEIADTSFCEQCNTELEIEIASCPDCGANAYRLPFDHFISDLEHFKVMDARYGGYVIGRTSTEDDIPMYTHAGQGIYSLRGFMQGGEYILSKAATVKYRARLDEINNETGTPALNFQPLHSNFSALINTNFMPFMGGLWISHAQYIINRFATQKYYTELEQLNWEANRQFADENPIVVPT